MEGDFMLFSSNYKLIQNLGIEIDSKTAKQMGTKYWMIIYYAFCQYGTIQSFSKNLIKKISLGPTGEYNIIIKWLSDLSGIELILNQEYYKKNPKNTKDQETEEIYKILKSIMLMSKKKTFIKTKLTNNYRQYVEVWNKPFILHDEYMCQKTINVDYNDEEFTKNKKVLRLYLKEINIDNQDPKYIYVSTYPDGHLYDREDEYIQQEKYNLENGNYKNISYIKMEQQSIDEKMVEVPISMNLDHTKSIDVENWNKDVHGFTKFLEYSKMPQFI